MRGIEIGRSCPNNYGPHPCNESGVTQSLKKQCVQLQVLFLRDQRSEGCSFRRHPCHRDRHQGIRETQRHSHPSCRYRSFEGKEEWVECLVNEIPRNPANRDSPLERPDLMSPRYVPLSGLVPQQVDQKTAPAKEPSAPDRDLAGQNRRWGIESVV